MFIRQLRWVVKFYLKYSACINHELHLGNEKQFCFMCNGENLSMVFFFFGKLTHTYTYAFRFNLEKLANWNQAASEIHPFNHNILSSLICFAFWQSNTVYNTRFGSVTDLIRYTQTSIYLFAPQFRCFCVAWNTLCLAHAMQPKQIGFINFYYSILARLMAINCYLLHMMFPVALMLLPPFEVLIVLLAGSYFRLNANTYSFCCKIFAHMQLSCGVCEWERARDQADERVSEKQCVTVWKLCGESVLQNWIYFACVAAAPA